MGYPIAKGLTPPLVSLGRMVCTNEYLSPLTWAGIISGFAYILVIIANTNTQLAIVSTLRETSVIFGSLMGVIFFKERPGKKSLFSSGLVSLGVNLMVYTKLNLKM